MIDFEVQKFSRRCAKTGRALQPGEPFFSVLVSDGADVLREDYAADAWQGPPEDSIGWWKSAVPDPRADRIQWAPNDVMLHYFHEMHESSDNQVVAYVLTLLLIRRRIFKLEASETEGTQEVLHVYCPRNEKEYRVAVFTPSAAEVEAIQRQLAELLFASADTKPSTSDPR